MGRLCASTSSKKAVRQARMLRSSSMSGRGGTLAPSVEDRVVHDHKASKYPDAYSFIQKLSPLVKRAAGTGMAA
jgi:hypothetical protein